MRLVKIEKDEKRKVENTINSGSKAKRFDNIIKLVGMCLIFGWKF